MWPISYTNGNFPKMTVFERCAIKQAKKPMCIIEPAYLAQPDPFGVSFGGAIINNGGHVSTPACYLLAHVLFYASK